jgi:adenine-specific DNA-methyltransferase
MANEIQELLNEVQDPRLKERLLSAIEELRKTKKFGLVFEEHLPELLPIYSAKVRSHARVARKEGRLSETFIVERVAKGLATVRPEQRKGEHENIPVAELVVVKRFGEAIFPALRHVESVLRGGGAQHHTLIEADNYHALQLLEWLYEEKVDCIYIDPPYNTGARTWKYNNNYVDDNDSYKHSKWLAMMKRRLLLAMRLLKPSGLMVITIDDYEMHRLRMLLDDLPFSSEVLGVVPIKNNPAGRTTVRGFAVAHEYAVFVARSPIAKISRIERTPEQIARYKERDELGFFEWTNFRKHGGTNTYKTTRPRQFYPIYVQGQTIRIPKLEWNEDRREYDVLEKHSRDEIVLWPIDSHGAERIWDFIPTTAQDNLQHLSVRP